MVMAIIHFAPRLKIHTVCKTATISMRANQHIIVRLFVRLRGREQDAQNAMAVRTLLAIYRSGFSGSCRGSEYGSAGIGRSWFRAAATGATRCRSENRSAPRVKAAEAAERWVCALIVSGLTATGCDVGGERERGGG